MRVDADLEAPPRFVKRDTDDVHMFHTGCSWRIVRGAGPNHSEILAEAASSALHPSTVGSAPWKVNVQGVMQPCSEFEVLCDGPNTEQVSGSAAFDHSHPARCLEPSSFAAQPLGWRILFEVVLPIHPIRDSGAPPCQGRHGS